MFCFLGTNIFYPLTEIVLPTNMRPHTFFFNNVFLKNVTKTIRSLIEGSRNISKTDKYLRESIIISANTRNLGLL